MLDQKSEASVLQITTVSGFNRKFDILLNNQLLKTVELPNSWDDKAVTHDVEIAESIRKDSGRKITILIRAHRGSTTGQVHSVRLLR